MKFEIDKQTLNDLEIFESSVRNKSVSAYFNFTKSLGGRATLKRMLQEPFTEYQKIKDRIELIHFFNSWDTSILEIDKNDLDFIEYYLMSGNRPTTKPDKYSVIENTIIQKIVGQNNEQYTIERGIDYYILVANSIFQFFSTLENVNIPAPLKNILSKVLFIKNKPEYEAILNKAPLEKLKGLEVASLDYVIRYTHSSDTRFLIDLMYELDALFALKKAIGEYGLVLPQVRNEAQVIDIVDLRHIQINGGVQNNIQISLDRNTMFLSGPNMAGKSTLLKAISVAVYLAHCGFPVPATAMSFYPLKGLYTAINIADNMSKGESHFYSEILRLKNVAFRLKEKEDMLVIFDELFRGTNVKDAYEGSLAVIKAFSKIKTSFFIFSTHIVELTKELETTKNIQFKYLETFNVDGNYSYSYKLKDGVSEDRLGMYIIKKEGLIELIESCSKKIEN